MLRSTFVVLFHCSSSRPVCQHPPSHDPLHDQKLRPIHHRAYLTLDHALRTAILLSLHLKPASPTPWPSKTSSDSRTFWAVRTLEHLLSTATSRPACFPLNDYNVPVPGSSDTNEVSGTHSSTLNVYTRITITAEWALSSLYTVKAATLSWQDVQHRVLKLHSELETLLPMMTDQTRLMLHFAWIDAMLMITRPCLVAPREHQDSVTQDMARRCVRAAQKVAQLLPDEPDACIFQNGPWWCLSHYIIRAVGVLRLTVSGQAAVGSEFDVAPTVNKLVRWLQWLAPDDAVAAQCLNAIGTARDEWTAAGFTEGYPFLQDGWSATTAQPQFMGNFHGMDDLVDSDNVISTMASQAQPGRLPMPPSYGDPYG